MSQAGATWTTASDRRDKRFIENIENKKSLDFINALKPVTYIYWGREEHGDMEPTEEDVKDTRRRSGFIAQDTYQTMIDVFGSDSYADIVDHNNYNKTEDDPEYEQLDKYYVRYTNLIPFLTGAIQELTQEINELKATIEELKQNR